MYILKDVLLNELKFQFFTLFPSASQPASTSTSMSTAIPLLPTFGAYLPTELLLTASGYVFQVKEKPDGSLNRYKVILVAKGFQQHFFFETAKVSN
jgi:hypothetical protein